ncbi:MAG: c-type cytochrome [Pseudomonadota bacterium]
MISILCLVALAGMTPESAGDEKGAALYKRCAACHLANGMGVPGSFPPLAGRLAGAANSAQGRAYLVMVISAGLMGEIDVAGETYRGVMPAQGGLGDEDIAALLNYLVTDFGEADDENALNPFTADEVKLIRCAHPHANGQLVRKLRLGVFEPPPTLEPVP